MNTLFEPQIQRGASFSPCRTWRYILTRRWNNDLPTWLLCGLNPSFADAEVDDQTIKKEIGFVRAWGGGGFVKINLFGLCSTDPKALYTAADPVGPLNDHWLSYLAGRDDIGKVVCCWGAHGSFKERGVLASTQLLAAKGELYVFGFTKNGQPKHPLRLAYNTPLIPWRPL